jgi:hypothetical protein
MHKIAPMQPSVLFCHLLQKCRIPVTGRQLGLEATLIGRRPAVA